MKTLLLTAALMLTATVANAENFYDARGNKIGSTSTTSQGSAGVTTNSYDARGNKLGSESTTPSGTSTFYDSRGNKTGSASGRPR